MGVWTSVLVEPVKTMLTQISNFLSSLALVLLILLVGWIIAGSLKNIIVRVLKLMKLDELSNRIKVGDFLVKGGIKYGLSELIGVVCYWLILLITFVVAANALHLEAVAGLLNDVILYIPRIVVAIALFIFGMFIASFLSSVVQTAASNAGIGQSKLLAKLVEITVMVFAVAISLEQLGIGRTTVILAVNIIIGSLGLAIALAFGLGCRDIAGKFVADLIEKLKVRK